MAETFSSPQSIIDAVMFGLDKTKTEVVTLVPNLIAALVIVLLGWAIGVLIARLVKKLLDVIKLEKFLETHKVNDALGNIKISKVLIQLTKYYIILVFVQAAVAMIALGPLTDFLTKVIDFAPKVIASVLVVVVAAVMGQLVKEKILEVHEKEGSLLLLANATKYVVIFVGVVVGLDTIGINTYILSATFITALQAIGFAVALAIGLAFGFGGQEAAKDMIKDWRKRLNL